MDGNWRGKASKSAFSRSADERAASQLGLHASLLRESWHCWAAFQQGSAPQQSRLIAPEGASHRDNSNPSLLLRTASYTSGRKMLTVRVLLGGTQG